MTEQQKTIKQSLTANKPGIILFAVLALLTLTVLIAPSGVFSIPAQIAGGNIAPTHLNQDHNQVKFEGKLSQTKIVQKSDGLVYLDLSIETPSAVQVRKSQKSSDLIVVLDTSGSMGAANKMPFAKAAIVQLLSQMTERDRFGLVSFSNGAHVFSPLVSVTPQARALLIQKVQSISPNGGTNMGDGLLEAMGLVSSDHNRISKILLLSDGEANQGITDPQQLAGLAAQFKHHESILSTIGMGLGFNEMLMSSLADHGMGNYSYLEDLSGLNSILAKDLSDSRKVFASASELVVDLGEGVRLLDAGGYPVTPLDSDKSKVKVSTGQLLGAGKKRLILTLSVPTDNISSLTPADISLIYYQKGEKNQISMDTTSVVLAVVGSEKRDEAIASVNKQVYKSSWVENNLGRLKKNLSKWVKEGKKQEADDELSRYRSTVSSAQAESNIKLHSKDLEDELDLLDQSVEAAFAGLPQDQKEKQNRVAKRLLSESINEQRSKVKH